MADSNRLAVRDIHDRLKSTIPPMEWAVHAPLIARIDKLKAERNAVILAHNYMTPEIFHGTADIVGDSLGLARKAAEVEADVIVMAGVHFMAETAKLINPNKTVLISDPGAGCSLAESIRPEDVRRLKEKHPGLPVVTYVNTSAAVKAECDVTCTSGNAVEVVEALDAPEILFIPDRYLASYVAGKTSKRIIPWDGACEVHEKFTAGEIREFRSARPGLTVIAHPECPREVIDESDFAGSTSQMIRYVEAERPDSILMVTECSMSDNLTLQFPDTEFVRPCNLCPHMKKITLEGILKTLETLAPEVLIAEEVAQGARLAVEKMLAIGAPS